MIEQLRSFTYERQRLGQAAPNAARALDEVIAVYSSHPSAPLSLYARAKAMTAAKFHGLDVRRLPAMRQSIHLLPAATAHLAFHATPAPPADRKKRMKHFKFAEQRYQQLRNQILEAATEPLTLPELREAVGAEANEFKGISAQMTRDGELLRVGAKGLRSNELRYVVAELDDADPEEALAWLAGEYLRAFGPVRPKDFQWWAGVSAGRAKQALGAHETEELDGGLHIRVQDVQAFTKAKPPKNAVDLLPKWDVYTMGYAPDGRDRFAHPDVVKQCYDFRGDGRPVILVDGQAAGTWEKGEPDPFEKLPAKAQRLIDERLTAVRAFLGD